MGVGGRLPPVQFHRPETGGSWLRVPQNGSQGKGIPGGGDSFCKGLEVSEGQDEKCLVITDLKLDFVFSLLFDIL